MTNQPTNQQYGVQSVDTAVQEMLVALRQKHTNRANSAYMELLEARKEGNAEAMSSAKERLDFHTSAEDRAHEILMSL